MIYICNRKDKIMIKTEIELKNILTELNIKKNTKTLNNVNFLKIKQNFYIKIKKQKELFLVELVKYNNSRLLG
jgi:glutamine cyclotransferase